MLKVATISDVSRLVEIENKMFNDNIYFKLSEKDFISLIKKRSTILYTWIEENKIVGYSLGIVVNKEHIWFNSLALLKEWQNSNIAKELFDAVENFAIDNKLKTVILEIREDNKALLRRYRGFKYCEWKTIHSYYPDGMNAIRMLKKL